MTPQGKRSENPLARLSRMPTGSLVALDRQTHRSWPVVCLRPDQSLVPLGTVQFEPRVPEYLISGEIVLWPTNHDRLDEVCVRLWPIAAVRQLQLWGGVSRDGRFRESPISLDALAPRQIIKKKEEFS